MTTLNTTQVPTAINTLERLIAYACLAGARVNPDLKILEVAGTTQKAVETTITAADDGTIRLIARVSLELNADYVEDTTQPLYMKVKELSNTSLPSAYLQA